MKTIILTLTILTLLTANGCAQQIGPAGLTGATGTQGVPGADGKDAQPCIVTSVGVSVSAPNGGSLITCPTTSTLVLNGTNGSNGIAGTPGTVVTMMKLCPGTTVYPSKFIEVAACINNTLYAVYSDHGGFLTEIPPGTYGSNGIDSSCNFMIGMNCTIGN